MEINLPETQIKVKKKNANTCSKIECNLLIDPIDRINQSKKWVDNRPKAEQGPVFLGFLKCKVLSVIIYRSKCGPAFLPTDFCYRSEFQTPRGQLAFGQTALLAVDNFFVSFCKP